MSALIHRSKLTDSRPSPEDVLVASLSISNGMDEDAIVAAHKGGYFRAASAEDLLHEASAVENRDLTLADLCTDLIVASGSSVGRNRSDEGLLTAAIECGQNAAINASTGISTTSLESVNTRIANISILAGWNSQEMVGRRIAIDQTLSDFKTHDIYRIMSVNGPLEELPPNGEIKHRPQLTEEKVQVRVKTYAGLISWSEEDIQNGAAIAAWQRSASQLGIDAAITEERLILSTLTSAARVVGSPTIGEFFASANAADGSRSANYLTGPTSALSLDSLGSLWQIMRDQKSYGTSINVRPNIVLTTTKNEIAMDEILTSTTTNLSGNTDRRAPNGNFFAKQNLTSLSSAYLTDASMPAPLTGNEFFLLHVNQFEAPIVTAHLRGSTTPQVEFRTASFNILALQARAVHRLGTATLSPRAAAMSLGA